MVKCKVAKYTSTIKTFGKYTQIYTRVIFNKNVIKTIESNRSLRKSIKDVLYKYERLEIKNCVYCISSFLYKKNTYSCIFEIKGAIILSERICKDKKEINSVLKDQEKVAKSIIGSLRAYAKCMNNSKVLSSRTKILKNDRKFQVNTKIILSTRDYYEIINKFQNISNFILELIDDYKREKDESLTFKESTIFEPPFGHEIDLISFVNIESYNKRLIVVNKHKQVVKLAERMLPEWQKC